MSACRGKADMTIGTCPLSWSLSGEKQTWAGAPQMSASDPKRTLQRVATHGSNRTFLSTFATTLSLMSKFLSRESEFLPIGHVRKLQMTQSGHSPSRIKCSTLQELNEFYGQR
jgi:hypothetical protein